MPCSVNPQTPLAAQLLPPSAVSSELFQALWLIPSSRRKVVPKPLDEPQPAARPLDGCCFAERSGGFKLLASTAASNFCPLLLLRVLAAFPLRLFAPLCVLCGKSLLNNRIRALPRRIFPLSLPFFLQLATSSEVSLCSLWSGF